MVSHMLGLMVHLNGEALEMQSAIVIQYTLCQMYQIAPHSPLAVCSVYVLKKMGNKQSDLDQAIHTIPAN